MKSILTTSQVISLSNIQFIDDWQLQLLSSFIGPMWGINLRNVVLHGKVTF